MRASIVSLCFVGSAVVLGSGAGCDSPSGGTTAVNCAQTPTAPACRPDTSGSDATFVPDGSPGTCSVGARQCAGDTPEVCQNGAWVPLAACGENETCTNGTCIEDSEECCVGMACGVDCGVSCGTCTGNTTCNQSGQCVPDDVCVPTCGNNECGPNGCGGSCGTCNVGESCQNGQCQGNVTCSCNGAECGEDNCGNSCGTCGGAESCVGGQCQATSTGTNGCSDLVDCIFGDAGCGLIEDEEDFNVCAEACYADASTTGQLEFDAYLTCANGCEDDRCFALNCSDEQAACFFDRQGNGTCAGVFDCFDTCADGDGDCIIGCYEAATTAAQAALIGINNCLEVECPDAPQDDPCYDAAAEGICAQFIIACQNN